MDCVDIAIAYLWEKGEMPASLPSPFKAGRAVALRLAGQGYTAAKAAE